MKLVFDASVVVDYLRTKKLSTVFVDAWKSYDGVISLVTVAELYSGRSVQQSGKARDELEEVLSGLDVVSPELKAVKLVGELRARYQLSLGDAFVAALALELDAPVAALDQKAFSRVKNLRLYPV
ncbi:PIN domain-containing protein [Candidatus Gottesmanbacteria bacterium]|nr:PIN domain-containing protein [Candidatus Gottesmanbacteria bacterium]